MQAMAGRLGSLDFEFVVMSVNIQRQVGGSLADLLDQVARDRAPAPAVPPQGEGADRDGPHVGLHAGRAAVPDGGRDLRPINPTLPAPRSWTTDRRHLVVVAALISISLGALILKKIVSFKV